MVEAIRVISKTYIICFIVLITFPYKIIKNKKYVKISFLLFALSLSYFAYYFKYSLGADLTRHYKWMDEIRNSHMSFIEFLLQNDKGIGNSSYVDLYTFNILRYFVISISDKNNLLSALCVFIDYLIIGYIFIDYSFQLRKNCRISILTFLLCFSFLPYVFAASGLRNALGACLMALGIYLYLFKQKSVVILIIITFLAMTIHPIVLITIPFVIMAKKGFNVTAYFVVFIISALIPVIARIMLNSDIRYLKLMGRKYFKYTSEEQYFASRAPLYVVILLISILLLYYFCFNKKIKKYEISKNRQALNKFLVLNMIYIIGNMGNYDMVLRPAYILGPFSIVLSSWFLECEMMLGKKIDKISKTMLKLGNIAICIILCVYLNYKFLFMYGE